LNFIDGLYDWLLNVLFVAAFCAFYGFHGFILSRFSVYCIIYTCHLPGALVVTSHVTALYKMSFYYYLLFVHFCQYDRKLGVLRVNDRVYIIE